MLTVTRGPGLASALPRLLGADCEGLADERRPVQPIRARAALSRAVSGWARVSLWARDVVRLAGCAAAIACRAAASREAGSFAALVAVAVLVVRVIDLRL